MTDIEEAEVNECNYALAKWNLVESELCKDCALTDTLEHYFFECHQSYTFWRQLTNWFGNTMLVYIPLIKFDAF